MARLPTPGGDNNTWGTILNEYLSVEHNADGTLKTVARPSDLTGKEDKTNKGAANGYASLDGSTKVPVAQIPDLSSSYARLSGTNTFESTQTIHRGYIIQDWSDQTEVNAPEHHFYGRSGKWGMGVDVANTVKSRDFVSLLQLLDYHFDDAGTTSGSPTLTSAAQGGFASNIVGAQVTGPGIQDNTTVLSVESPTSLTMNKTATATASNVRVHIVQPGYVSDLLYIKHRGALSPTFGFAITPPDGSYRVQIGGSDSEAAMGGLGVRVGASQTGHAMAVIDSAPNPRFWVDKDFYLSGNHGSGSAVALKAESTNQRPLAFFNSAATVSYGFEYNTTSLRFRYFTGGLNLIQWDPDGRMYIYNAFQPLGEFRHQGGTFGALNATPVARQTVSGSRGGNAALASLLTALANFGFITDSTSA